MYNAVCSILINIDSITNHDTGHMVKTVIPI